MTDSPLQRVARGDADAVREVVDTYGGLVWSLAHRYLGDRGEAEDASQEIFVEVWRVADRYDPEKGSEATFIALIARRRLIDRRRRRAPETPIGSVPDESPVEAAPHAPEDGARALQALAQLSPEQQRAINLSVRYGLSHDQIATATGTPLGTVKTNIRRGMLRLREILEASPDTVKGGVA